MKKFKQHVWAIYIVWCIPMALLGFVAGFVFTIVNILFDSLFVAPYEVGKEYFYALFLKLKNQFNHD
jgi:hypothetical protein